MTIHKKYHTAIWFMWYKRKLIFIFDNIDDQLRFDKKLTVWILAKKNVVFEEFDHNGIMHKISCNKICFVSSYIKNLIKK